MARKEKLRLPNPAKPVKGRLDAPPAKAHAPKKRYRRKAKHPGKDDVE
jgi:hypothetical protein